MEQNREPRNTHTNMANWFWQSSKGNSVKKEWSFPQTMMEELDIHKQKHELWPKPHTLYKRKRKMNRRAKCKACNYKTFRRSRDIFFDLELGRVLFIVVKNNTNVLSYVSGGRNLGFTGLKSRCQQGCSASGSSREETVSMPFPASRRFLGLWPPYSILKASTVASSNLSLFLSAPAPSVREFICQHDTKRMIHKKNRYINKLDFIKIKNSYFVKDTIKIMKDKWMNENICKSYPWQNTFM